MRLKFVLYDLMKIPEISNILGFEHQKVLWEKRGIHFFFLISQHKQIFFIDIKKLYRAMKSMA